MASQPTYARSVLLNNLQARLDSWGNTRYRSRIARDFYHTDPDLNYCSYPPAPFEFLHARVFHAAWPSGKALPQPAGILPRCWTTYPQASSYFRALPDELSEWLKRLPLGCGAVLPTTPPGPLPRAISDQFPVYASRGLWPAPPPRADAQARDRSSRALIASIPAAALRFTTRGPTWAYPPREPVDLSMFVAPENPSHPFRAAQLAYHRPAWALDPSTGLTTLRAPPRPPALTTFGGVTLDAASPGPERDEATALLVTFWTTLGGLYRSHARIAYSWRIALHAVHLLPGALPESWRVAPDRIMQYRGPHCPLCRTGVESYDHLLFACPVTHHAWAELMTAILPLPPRNWNDLLGSFPTHGAAAQYQWHATMAAFTHAVLQLNRFYRFHSALPPVNTQRPTDFIAAWLIGKGSRYPTPHLGY